MRQILLLFALLYALNLAAQPACATANCCCGNVESVNLPGGNFEDAPNPPSNGRITFFAGEVYSAWSIDAGSIDLLGPDYAVNWASGNPNGASNFIDLHGFTPGTISTDLENLSVGCTYTISIWYAKNTGTGSANCNVQVAGGAWLNETWSASNNGADGWLEKCYTFTAQGASAELRFAGSGGTALAGVLLDDITLWKCCPDTEAPVITSAAPQDMVLECSDVIDPAPELSTSDNCDLPVDVQLEEVSNPDPCSYTITRMWTVTDGCGNTTTQEQSIQVMDTQAPEFLVPPTDYTATCSDDYITEFLNWIDINGGAEAVDNCATDIIWQVNYFLPSGQCTGTPVTFTISDGCGHSQSATATFFIEDNDPPNLTLPANNLVLLCNPNAGAIFNNWLNNHAGAQASDPCGTITWDNDYPGGPPPSDEEVFVTFTATDACFNSVSTSAYFQLITSSDTTVINTTTCDPAAAGSDTLVATMGSCTNVIITNVSLVPADTTLLSGVTCDPSLAGVFTQSLLNQNGCDSLVLSTILLLPSDTTMVTDKTCNPNAAGTFTQILSNQNGCDSVVITQVTYALTDTTYLTLGACDTALTGVFIQNLQSSDGCDSLVITTVNLLPAVTTNLAASTCDPANAGVFIQNLLNQNGCDSIVTTTVTLLPGSTTTLATTTCDPADAGVFVQNLLNQNGCDSIVTTTVTLLPGSTTTLAATTCAPANAGVFVQNLFNQNGCDSIVTTTVTLLPGSTTTLTATTCNPANAGMFVQNLFNQNGCDSIVTTTVTLLPGSTTTLTATTCDPANAGVFVQNLLNQNGCDSTVITTVTLLPASATNLSATTCNPADAGVFVQNLLNQNGCDSIVTTTVTLLPASTTNLSATTCNPADVGVFVQNLLNQNGCDSIVTTTVTLLPASTTNLSATTCNPAEVGVFVQNLLNQNGCDSIVTTTVTLLPGNTTNLSATTCNPADVGVFVQNLLNQNGCDSLVTTTVTLEPDPQISITTSSFNGFELSCLGSADGTVSASSTATTALSWLWSNNANTAVVQGLPAGQYTVTVTTAAGCTASAVVTLEAPPAMQVGFALTAPDCFDELAGRIEIDASGGVAPYQFALNAGSFQTNNTFENLGSGVYQIMVQDANDCQQSETLVINAPPNISVDLGDDLQIALGDTAVLTAVVNVPASALLDIQWGPLDTTCVGCVSLKVSPFLTTAYTIRVVNEQGCSDQDTVRVSVNRRKDLYAPNIFSPNGDGLNDVFTLFARPGAVRKVHTLQIYDRWGEAVYREDDFDLVAGVTSIGWDGQYRNSDLQPAVFVWYAQVEFVDGTLVTFSGDVTLIR